jgi:DNA-binding GntR family transcriptional regulator
VPEATVEVISDLVRIRCAIEGSAAEWAASTINTDELEALDRLNDGMVTCTAAGDTADYLALNREFHFTIYRAARSSLLLPVIERFWLRAGPWLNIMREETTLGLGLDHHAEIMAALTAGNGAAAKRALVADIADAGDIMIRAASGRSVAPRSGTRKGSRKTDNAVAQSARGREPQRS